MPPGMKALKFDLTLLTGNLERNFKRCAVGLMKGWRDFGQNMKKSSSFLEAGDAIYAFGKKGVESIMALFHPYEELVKNIIAAVVALRQLCSEFEKVEKAGLRAANAFNTGGRLGTGKFSKYQATAQGLAQNGTITQEEALTGIASIAQNNHSLDEETLDRLMKTSKDAAAFLGGDYSSTLEKLGDILDDTTTSYETLRGVGLEFTRAEVEQIKALKEAYSQTEANELILSKMEQVYKGAEEAQRKTISGQFQVFGNIWTNMQTSIGKALAPVLEFVMALVNPIMELGSAILEIFNPLGDLLKRNFAPLEGLFTGLLQPLIEGIRFISSALSDVFGEILNIGGGTETIYKFWKFIGNALGQNLKITGQWISMIIKAVGVALTPVINAAKTIYNFIQKFIDGFKKGFGSANLDIFGRIYAFVTKLMDAIKKLFALFANNPIIKFLGTLIYDLGVLVGSITGELFNAVNKIIDNVTNGLEKVMDSLNETYFKAWEALGFDMSEERAAYEKSKNPNENSNKNGWVDPRMKINTSFEGATSMTQRIQTAIMSKNSPQAKMVDYLHDIRDYMKGMNDAQNKQVEAQKEDNALMKEQNKKLGNLEPGLA